MSGEYREQVYDAFADRSLTAETAIDRALEAGRERLEVGIGFLTCVEDGTQTIERSVGSHDAIAPGNRCPLDEAYCRRTVETEGLTSVQNASASDLVDEVAYDRFGLGCYIGGKVLVDGSVYGTLCFADEATRDRSFSEAEQLFVELVARLTGSAIERQRWDRTRRDRIERLDEERRRFEGIADASSDIIYRIGSDGRFTYVSAAVEHVLGYEPSALVGEPLETLVAADDRDRITDVLENVFERHPVRNMQLDLLAADGERVPVEVNSTVISPADGEFVVQGVARDVSEREDRTTELRLKNSAVDAARVGITIVDVRQEDDPVVYANDAFQELTGYDTETILGANCRILQGSGTAEEPVARLREAIADREPASVELLNYRASETPFWNRVSITPVTDDAGEVTHFVGFQQDVTAGKRTTRLIEVLNRVLRHNLRNEMNAVRGYVDLIESGDATAAHADRIREATDELVNLSDRARELESYATADRAPERIATASLLTRVADEYRAVDDVTIAVDAVDDVSDVCAGPEIERAVRELVDNAICHDSDPPTEVTLDARDVGEWVELTVVDDGPGIPADEAAVIESGRETPLEHGTGLGLWLVNWIATRYGGSFQTEATDDGTVATVRLPAIAADESVEDAAKPPTTLFR
ncbi:PAS domain-containing protein [Halostella salina]|uniref:PAS domain-containing protein n=1 Tax=Halostella salina TaxID=1547897 RepID=UPI000EF7EBB0|nr:PAS domain S-box protein [Halostella salina]